MEGAPARPYDLARRLDGPAQMAWERTVSYSDLRIRPERPEDYAAIREINRIAFGRDAEARLVEALRASPGFDKGSWSWSWRRTRSTTCRAQSSIRRRSMTCSLRFGVRPRSARRAS